MDVGIIGFPLRHSISPVFQQAAIDDIGLDITYNLWETPSSQLEDRVNHINGQIKVTETDKKNIINTIDRVEELEVSPDSKEAFDPATLE